MRQWLREMVRAMNVPRLKSTICNPTQTPTTTPEHQQQLSYPKSMGLTDTDEQTREETNKMSLLVWLIPLAIVSLTVIVLLIACNWHRVCACFVSVFESVKTNAAASKLIILSRVRNDQHRDPDKIYQPGCLRESATATTTTSSSTQSLRSSSLSHQETTSKQLFMVYNRDDSIRVELIAPLLESQLKSQHDLTSIRVEFQHASNYGYQDWTRLIAESDWVVFVSTNERPIGALELKLIKKTPQPKRILLSENTTSDKSIRKLFDRQRIYELRRGGESERNYSSSLSSSSAASTTVTGGDAASSCSSNEDMRLVEFSSSPGSSVTSRNQYYFPPNNYHNRPRVNHHHSNNTRRIANEYFYAREQQQHRKFDI